MLTATRTCCAVAMLAASSCWQPSAARDRAAGADSYDQRYPAATIIRPETMTRASLAVAVQSAIQKFAAAPSTTVILKLPAGSFDLDDPTTTDPMIDLRGIEACPGRFILEGAGMRATTLSRRGDAPGVYGRGVTCVTIANLTLRQTRLEISQGTVVQAGAVSLVVQIDKGFPSVGALMAVPPARDSEGRSRYWLKRFVKAPGGSQLAVDGRSIRWIGAQQVTGAAGRWTINIARREGDTTFGPGDLIAITSKSGGQAYRFINGHDITFDGVRWIGDARGKFRYVDNLTIKNCVIERPDPINGVPFLLSTSGGGPQIGNAGDPTVKNLIVENNSFTATGDDSIAVANTDGVVRNNRVTDATRGLLIVGQSHITEDRNSFVRAPVVRKAKGGKERERRQ